MALGTAYSGSFTNRYGTWPKDGLQLMFWDNNLGSYPRSGTTIKDLSGNSRNGTLQNFSSPPTSTSGYYNGAIQYDGNDDYISFPGYWMVGLTEFSWHFIIKRTGVPNSHGQTTMSFLGFLPACFMRLTPYGAGYTISPFIRGNLADYFMYFAQGSQTNIVITDFTKFYHVTVCVKPGLIKTYFNGALNDQRNLDIGSLQVAPNNLGRYGSAESWLGNIPVFMAYDKFLEQEDISQIYNYFKRFYY